MKQIYVNTTEKVYLKIYQDGVPTDSDYNPTYSVTVVGSGNTPRTGTAVHESTGVYYVLTELDESLLECQISVTWQYTVSGETSGKTDYINVVTPYVNFYEMKAKFPDETNAEVENAELFARYMINNYTGQSFGKRSDIIKMHGNDKEVLVLPQRIISLTEIKLEDEVVWTPSVNDFGRNVEITDTNYGLRAYKFDEVPVWSDGPSSTVWNKYKWYSLSGVYGWEQVPDEVNFVAQLLVEDYFCKETAWKKRFVEQINASDWRIVFNQKQFQGTGNFFADQILSDFRSINMVAI
jgi:hypothetical protein